MIYRVEHTSKFKKDLKLLKKRSADDFMLLREFIEHLQEVGFNQLDQKYQPHKLKGEYKDCFECHVRSDLLLVWRETNEVLELVRTGTHSDLF